MERRNMKNRSLDEKARSIRASKKETDLGGIADENRINCCDPTWLNCCGLTWQGRRSQKQCWGANMAGNDETWTTEFGKTTYTASLPILSPCCPTTTFYRLPLPCKVSGILNWEIGEKKDRYALSLSCWRMLKQIMKKNSLCEWLCWSCPHKGKVRQRREHDFFPKKPKNSHVVSWQ